MSGPLDLLFIQPPSRVGVYQSLARDLAAIENPIWAGLLAEAASRAGYSVEILDAEAAGLSIAQAADQATERNARLMVMMVYGQQPSASTQILPAASSVTRAIKVRRPAQEVLLVGGHVAALPEQTLREEGADYVAAGEGLDTVLGLLAAKASGSNLSRVPGLWYWDEGRPVGNRATPLADDLARHYPGGGWNFLKMNSYRAHNWHCLGGIERGGYAALYTTLGCPFHCGFCCIQAPFRPGENAAGFTASRNSYRYWPAEHVLAQIDLLVREHGVRNLKIADEMFVLNPRHVRAICAGLIRRHYDLNIWAYSRVDTAAAVPAEMLRAAGIRWLAFGIESGAARVRDDIDKRFDDGEVYRVLEAVQGAGIHVMGNFIFGLPEDDVASMRQTLDLARALPCDFVNFYCAMAYPGSPLYADAIRAGVPLPQSWSGYSQHGRDCLPLPTRHVSAREVLAFRDAAFQEYFSDSAYLMRVERTFGGAARSEIESMTAHTLERDLLTGRLDVPDVLWPAAESTGTLVPIGVSKGANG